MTTRKRLLIILLLLGMFQCLHIESVIAATINIPGDYSLIQDGINAASDGDTIVVEWGTYVESINYYGKELLLTSRYLYDENVVHVDSTIIEGNSPVVHFSSQEDSLSILQGFTIQSGSPGIMCSYSSPRIRANTIRDNTRGIYLFHSSAIIEYNRIINNEVQSTEGTGAKGAGIKCEYSDAIVRGNTIDDNEVSNMIEGNFVETGGAGIYAYQSDIIIENNTVAGNNAWATLHSQYGPFGGGIALSSCSEVLIEGNIIKGNNCNGCYNGAAGGVSIFMLQTGGYLII